MPQNVLIRGLNGRVEVYIVCEFEPAIPHQVFDRHGKKTTMPFEKGNDYYATFKLDDKLADGKKRQTNLTITAIIRFPSHDWVMTTPHTESLPYTQEVSCTFTNVVFEVGKPTIFDDIGPNKLETDAIVPNFLPYDGPTRSQFQYLDGAALVSASDKNPQTNVIKIKLILGSRNTEVLSTTVEEKEPTWKFSAEAGKEADKGDTPNKGGVGGVIDKVRTFIAKIGFKGAIERSGKEKTTGTSQSMTINEMWAEAEWQLTLQMPEPKPQPQPVVKTITLPPHPVYFLTGKHDLKGANNDAKAQREFPNHENQLTFLMKFMDGVGGNVWVREHLAHRAGRFRQRFGGF